MKNTKKILSIILSLLLVIGMMSTFAFAEGTETTGTASISIKIINGDSDVTSQYNIYQILKGNITAAQTDESGNITKNAEIEGIEWGNAVKFTDNKVKINSVEYLKSVADAVKFATSLSSEAYKYDSSASVALATELSNVVDTVNKVENANSVEQGYYLIIQQTSDTDTAPATRFMLKAVGSAGITVDISTKKTTAPDPDKNVVVGDENQNETSASIGDELSYVISAKLPEAATYDAYTKYELELDDTLPDGLTYNKINTIYYTTKSDSNDSKKNLIAFNTKDSKGFLKNVTNPIITEPSYNETKIGGGVLKIKIDTKALNIPAEATIYVKYTTTLNKNAVSGSEGNKNSFVIKYPQDPNSSNKVSTEKKEVPVYTGKIIINKYDAKDTELKLSDAWFVVYKMVDNQKLYLKIDNTTEAVSWIEITDDVDKSEDVYVAKTDELGSVTIKGLEAGEYYLQEIKAPENYNLLAEAVKVELTLNPGNDSVKMEVNANVPNNSGATLPETGGIGTTIFYIAGAILVVGAGVVFVTRRRMHSDN